jgi:hypothetical protein
VRSRGLFSSSDSSSAAFSRSTILRLGSLAAARFFGFLAISSFSSLTGAISYTFACFLMVFVGSTGISLISPETGLETVGATLFSTD